MVILSHSEIKSLAQKSLFFKNNNSFAPFHTQTHKKWTQQQQQNATFIGKISAPYICSQNENKSKTNAELNLRWERGEGEEEEREMSA